jgi:hypothetical protein
VPLLIRGRVDVDLEHPDVRVFDVVGQPIGLDEHVIGIAGHVESSIRVLR